ncbi:CAAX prenyl protease 1, putative [Indibacter alkaliphilus LW1]|uniref:CAAX prenyl protease 1, putative n=1 Tax=Indibacter alkaliphilus (strain CCUG 57479 / KCTC 22604 / LW1) TaxID=1189612 RepID=S2E4D2_INDAL|nr:M48 family metallopeptidase [Indibacter alkaliphilus]EOZ97078.1 CAAX prenyl protease 1, putative [Indibacter alkaliphilus LW1]
MDAEWIKYLLLGVLTFGFIFEKGLSYLNNKRPIPNIPTTLEQYISKEKLSESKKYQLSNFKFGILTGTITFLLTFAFIYFGFFGWVDLWLRDLIENPILLSLAYFGVIFIGSDLISIPFDYYHTFVIEEHFGFNKTNVKTYFSDKVKGYILSIIIGGGLLGILLWLIHQIGKGFWWQFWLISAFFMISVNLFYTAWILPLFNKLTPLEDGELKAKIVQYAKSVNFPIDNIFVIDGSKRSSKANAFFSGFGRRKKVVLYDTLIEQHTPEELVAVLAHEVGHYKKKHIIFGMLTSVLHIGIMLFILAQFIFSENMSLALGGDQLAVHLNIIGFTMLFSPISMILGIGMNLISRKNEFEADDFAKESFSGVPLAEALKTLSVNSLSNINPHPWYVFVNYSHPPLLERLEKLER